MFPLLPYEDHRDGDIGSKKQRIQDRNAAFSFKVSYRACCCGLRFFGDHVATDGTEYKFRGTQQLTEFSAFGILEKEK